MTNSSTNLKKSATREAILCVALLISGAILLPFAVYIVGQSVFGEYAGAGLSEFLKQIFRSLRDGQGVVWFLVLSPYFGWQLLRLTVWLFRRTALAVETRPR